MKYNIKVELYNYLYNLYAQYEYSIDYTGYT